MTAIEEVLKLVGDRGFRKVTTVHLFDPRLIEQHDDLEAEMLRVVDEDGRHNRTPQAPKIAAQIAELEERIEESALQFRLGALSFSGWNQLLAAHPPTKKQLEEHKARGSGDWRSLTVLDHNPTTFPPALVAACSIDPEMSVEQATELMEQLGPDQFEMLYQGALGVNRKGEQAPKSVAAGRIHQLSEAFAGTAVHAGSPDPSSSDGS